MFEKRLLRGLLVAMGLALLVALSLPMAALADEDDPPSGPDASAVGHVTISGNPLTIHVAQDTSIQVFYAGQSGGQVYPPGFNEADSGGFGLFEFQTPIPFGPEIWGPNFLAHDSSTANMMLPWAPAGPQITTGTGTTGDPWWVQTDVFGPFVFNVTQWVGYVDGDPCFSVTYIVNDGELGQALPITFFHAANMHPDGDEGGFGYYDAASGAVGALNGNGDFLEYLVPYTWSPASHYQEAGYQTIWNAIGTGPISKGPGFNDTILATPYHDTGCGLQWDLALPGVQPPGNFIEFGLDWCFLEVEEPEFVPEPGSILLLASGFMGLAGYAGLRARKR